MFYSPYLNEIVGKNVGRLLFSFTCLIALFNSNFSMLLEDNLIIIQIVLMLMFVLTGYATIREFNRLFNKFTVLGLYYESIQQLKPYSKFPSLIDDLRNALNRKDWDEAVLLTRKYQSLKEKDKKSAEKPSVHSY